MGIGPLVVAPSATSDAIGTGKWQFGGALVFFLSKSSSVQFGGLLTYQASIAGDDNRPGTSVGALQPFLYIQLGNGVYVRSTPIWTVDFKNDAYSFLLALGIGKVQRVDKMVFNMYIEPQFTALHKGTQPQFQLFAGVNLQFMKGGKK